MAQIFPASTTSLNVPWKICVSFLSQWKFTPMVTFESENEASLAWGVKVSSR